MIEELHRTSVPRLTIRVARYLPFLLLLGLAVHLILPRITRLEHALAVIRHMAWWTVALALLAQALSYLSIGYLLHAIAATTGERLTLARGTLVGTAAASIGLVAGGPVGNAAAIYRWLRGSDISTEAALLAGWVPSLFINSLLLLIAIAGLLHLLVVHELSTLQAAGFGLILLLLVLIVTAVVWGVRHRPQLDALIVRAANGWSRLRRRPPNPDGALEASARVYRAWDALRAGGWRGPALGAMLVTAFDMLTLYFLFVAAGHAVSPGVLLTGYGLPLLLGKASFLPGGVGIVEGTMAVLYDGLGVPDPVTVVVILSYRAISFWLPTLLGFPLILYLQRVDGKLGR